MTRKQKGIEGIDVHQLKEKIKINLTLPQRYQAQILSSVGWIRSIGFALI